MNTMEHFEMISKANTRTGNYDFECPNCGDVKYDLWYSSSPTLCFECNKPENITQKLYTEEQLIQAMIWAENNGRTDKEGQLKQFNEYIQNNLLSL